MKKLSLFSGVGEGVAQELPRRRSPISPEVTESFMNSLLLDLPTRRIGPCPAEAARKIE
jgi:hypothetical protein